MKCQENASFSSKTYINYDVIMEQSQTMHVEKNIQTEACLNNKSRQPAGNVR